MRVRGLIGVLLLGVMCNQSLAADLKTTAAEAYKGQRWAEAEVAYAEIVAAEPANGQAWFRLGVARHQSGKIDDAIAAYKKAADLQFAPVFSAYNLAAAYARKKDATSAYAWLEKAINAGFSNGAGLSADQDFAALRDDEQFRKALAQIEARAHPCHGDEYHALDFWVGAWDVRDTKAGHPVGTSNIERILDGCVIFENWTGMGGGAGKSFNTIDRATKKWRQTWTDASGSLLDFTGEPSSDAMTYRRQGTGSDGKPMWSRMTLSKLPTGEVRQLVEQSADQQAWSTTYDFTYKRH